MRNALFRRSGFTLLTGLALCASASPIQSAPPKIETGQAISISSNGEPLTGLLSPELASKSAPLAILIQGSGPTDRDGNSSSTGLASDNLKMLAAALNANGIRTFRADKRGQFTNKGAGGSVPVTTTMLASDVKNFAAELTLRNHLRCVWLIGHSAGSLVSLIAAQHNPKICGIISLAGAGRPLGILIRAQFKANPGNAPILDDAFRIITDLEFGKSVDVSALHPALRAVFSPASQPVWIDLFSYDPAKLAGTLHKPILIIQGDNDLQVSVEDASMLAKAVREAPVIVPGMNHMLKIAPADQTSNLATYRDPTLPLAPGLVERITGFIKGHSGIHFRRQSR